MTVSKAQQKSVNKYIKTNYDRINLLLNKGEKDIIKKEADKTGESLNSYIKNSIYMRIKKETE